MHRTAFKMGRIYSVLNDSIGNVTSLCGTLVDTERISRKLRIRVVNVIVNVQLREEIAKKYCHRKSSAVVFGSEVSLNFQVKCYRSEKRAEVLRFSITSKKIFYSLGHLPQVPYQISYALRKSAIFKHFFLCVLLVCVISQSHSTRQNHLYNSYWQPITGSNYFSVRTTHKKVTGKTKKMAK